MLFKDVIGLEDVKQHLTEMVKQNRLSHALLFLGKEGCGALPLALAFAQYVVSQPQPSPVVEDLFGGFTALEATPTFIHPDEIQSLPAFQRAEQLLHPDLHFSYPVVTIDKKKRPEQNITEEKKERGNRAVDYIEEWREFIQLSPYGNISDWINKIKQTENQQGNISAAECHDIIKKLSLKSFESEYKVLLLWMPEYLGKEGNRLLKLIEEPPPNTLFIFVAENDEQILPTILSRCQLVKIPMLQIADIEQALISRANIPTDTAHQIASICEGNYREALQLLQHAEEDWQSLLREWLNATLKGGPVAQIKFTDEISKLGREKQKQFLRYFNHLLEQSIRIKILGVNNISLATNEKDFAQRLNKIASVSQQRAIIEELDKATYYIERNANAKMLFQALTIKLFHIIQNKVVITA